MPFDLGIIRRQRYVSTATAANVTTSTYARGGTITSYTYNGTTYIAHIFTSSGIFTVTSTVYPLEWFAVGGGGAGGSSFNGQAGAAGGGAGGILTGQLTPVSRVVPSPLYIAATTSSVAAVAGGWITGTNVTDFTGATGNFLFDWRNVQNASGGARSMPLPEADAQGNRAFYFEIYIRSLPRADVLVGLIRDGVPLSGYTNVPCIYLVGGTGFGGTTGGTALGNFVAGDTLQIAYQCYANPAQVFFGKNNTWYLDPNSVSGTGFTGTNAIRLIMFSGAAAGGTLNGLFRAGNENIYAPPTGFSTLSNYTGYYPNPVPAGTGYITSGTTWNVVVGAGGSTAAILTGTNQSAGLNGGNGSDSLFYPTSTTFSYYSGYFFNTKLRASNSSFNFGSSDFTIEMWIYPTAGPEKTSANYNRTLIDTRNPDVPTGSWDFYLDPNYKLGFGQGYSLSVNPPGTQYFLSNGTITAYKWTHIALTRKSNYFNLWINGVPDSLTYNYSNAITFTTTNISIAGGAQYLTYAGYISNLRLVNGVAVYTGTFVPSSTPLTVYTNPVTNITYTSLLLNVASSGAYLNDSSLRNTNITNVGSVTYNAATPFSTGGSLSFNGSTQYLTIPSSADFTFGSGDWTIECWIYPTAVNIAQQQIITKNASIVSSAGAFILLLENNLVKLYSMNNGGGSGWLVTSLGTTPVIANAWSHVAATRFGNTFSTWANGVSTASITTSFTLWDDPAVPLVIGSDAAGASKFSGFITNVRIVKGTAVYTRNFTPPTQNLTTSQSINVISGSTIAAITTQTVLLTLVSQNNSSITTDFSNNNVTFTTSGTAVTTSSMMSPFYAFSSTNIQSDLVRAVGGGGGGGAQASSGQIGGSGGGGGYDAPGGAGIPGQGYNGGRGSINGTSGGGSGGGGGYASPGQLCLIEVASQGFVGWEGGRGGDGAYFNYTGVSTAYGGGGGGGDYPANAGRTGGPGGLGGGGDGSGYKDGIGTLPAIAGLTNTGGGGGGGSQIAGAFDWRGAGGAGGSGIVVFRYPANLGDADRYPTGASDTYFKNTTLLLSANQPTTYKLPVYGSTGSAVTIDYLVVAGGGGGGGGNTSTISVSGAGTISGAVSFAGNGQYLTIAATYQSAWSFSGDFTVEAWVYWPGTMPTDTGQYAILSNMTSAENRFWELQYYNNTWRFVGYGTLVGVNDIPLWGITGNNIVGQGRTVGNTWYHIAATRSGTTGKIWVGGVDVTNVQDIGSADLTPANVSKSSALYIGQSGLGSSYRWTGYITNVRITKGQALYNTTFTPATPLSAGANTTVLLLFNTDLTKLFDSSTNAFPVTNNGGVTWENTTLPSLSGSPWTGGSLSFSGGNSITVPYSASAFLLTGDFTVEMWIYPTSFTGPNSHGKMVFSNGGQSGGDTDGYSLIMYSSGLYIVTRRTGGVYSQPAAAPAGGILLFTWYHVAYVRYNGNHNLWLNGVFYSYSGNQITDTIGNSGYPFSIGDESVNSRYNDPFTGYITGVRVINGTAAYTTTLFPSGFIPGIPMADVTNTKLLLNVASSGAYLTDSSSSPLTPANPSGVTFNSNVPSAASVISYSVAGISGGGGGGGGLLAALGYPLPGTLNSDGTYTLNTTTYTITVGSGGSGGTGGASPNNGSSGTNSSISFSNTNIVAYGGGGGATYGQAGSAGGSGGGGTGQTIGGSGIVVQGNAGAPVTYGFININSNITAYPGGGGGGAGTTGTTGTVASPTTVGGTGGIGSSSTIITAAIAAYAGVGQVVGTSVYFAGGGSGNGATAGAISYGNGIPGSLSFNGSSYLTVPTSTTFQFGTNNFTAEAWVFRSVAWTAQNIFFCQWSGSTGGTTLSWAVITSNDTNGYARFLLSTDGTAVLTDSISSTVIPLNQWNHIAFVRNSNTFTLYLNGTSVVTYSIGTPSLYAATNTISIGASSAGTQPFTGYITNARIVKGLAVYTGNFTTATSSLQTTQAANPYGGSNTQAILTASYTSLLLVPQSTYDSSIYANVVSNVGGVVYVNTNTPYTIPSNGTGGGGLGGSTSTSGTTGSSGVVVIRYNSVIQDATYTPGTATFINTGGYKTYIFTATGTLSFSTSTLFNTTTYVSGTITSSTINNRAVIDTSYNYLTSNLNTGSLTFTQGSFSPYGSLWSTAFNGTSDYFSFTSTGTAFAQNTFFGANKTFTVESWLYPNGFQTASTSSVILGDASPTGGQLAWSVGIDSQNRPMLYWRDSANTNYFITATNFLSTSSWNHVAWVVNAGTPTIFVNGIYQITTASTISTLTNTTQTQGMVIGAYGAKYYNGFISNLRAVSGTALYSRDPTNLNQKSLYFDGTNQSLSISRSYSLPALGLYLTPYTLECWVFPNVTAGQYIFGTAIYNNNAHFILCTCTSSPGDGGSNLFFGFYNAGMIGALSSTQLPLYRWSHVAGVYDGVQHNLYLNGVKIAVSPGSVAVATITTSTLYIGRKWDVASNCFNGYLSNVRLVIGTAIYTSNFTPPTTSLTSITNTVLLTLLPTDATIVDSSINAVSITPAVTPVFVTGTYPNVLPSFSVPTSPLPASANTVLLTMNSNQFVDSSTSTIALSTGTATSTPKIQRFSPFPLGSAYNPATLGGSALFNGTSDFIYTNTLTSTSTALQLSGSGLSITNISAAQSAATGIFSFSFNNIQGSSGGARSTALRDSGSYYFEVVYNSGDFPLFGLARDTSTGGYSNVPSIYAYDGTGYGGMTGGTTLTAPFSSGDIIRIAYNASTNKVWIGRNAVWYLDPVSTAGSTIPGTGNLRFIIMSGASFGSSTTGTFRYYTANTYSPPAGFTNATYSGGTTIAADAAYNAQGWVSASTDYSTSAIATVNSVSSSYNTGGDFTIEMWLYVNSLAAAQTVFDLAGNYGNTLRPDSLALNLATSGFYSIATNNSTSPNSNRAILPFTWNHIAMVRSGPLISIFQNGSPTLGYNTTTNYSAGQLVIGRNGPTATSYFNGYISDFRIVKRALYSNTFNPPLAPLTTVDLSTSTSLLLNFNQASLIDKTALTNLTPQDGPIISTSVVKYNPGSFYFNGISDYLSITPAGSTATYALGVSDFTVEMWVYALPVSTWVGTQLQPATVRSLFDMRTINLANVGFDIYLTATGTLNFSTTGLIYITGTTPLPTNFWHHIALVRRNNVFVLFLNGIQEGNPYSGSITQNFTNSTIRIGFGVAGVGYFNGYIDEVRITKGVARYSITSTSTYYSGFAIPQKASSVK